MDRAALVSANATPDVVARETFVIRLRDAGVGLDAAEHEATRRYGPRPVPTRDERIREKDEQHEVTKRFRVCGFTVRNLSQARASKQAPGLPDLFITHDTKPRALWWETKRQVGGKYSDAQRAFKADCQRCGVICEGGDRYAAESWLVLHGHATIGSDGKITRVGTALDPSTPEER